MTLGSRLAEKRIEAGLSQAELAEKIKSSPTMISLYESDSRRPSYAKLELISHYLETTVDYLMNGKLDAGRDPISKRILLALRTLNSKQRNQVYQYICNMSGSSVFQYEFPIHDTAEKCAEALIKYYDIAPPVDPFAIAAKLDVRMLNVEGNAEYEGMLLKTGSKPTIIIDNSITDQNRRRFTMAMLLGHLVMPWHLKPEFGRKHNEPSKLVTDHLSIEAREFAIALLAPRMFIEKGRKGLKETYSYFETQAYGKYGVSTTSFIKRYLEVTEKKDIIFLRSHEGRVREYNEVGFPYKVVKDVNPDTFAGKLSESLPTEETLMNGYVDASLWFIDAPSGLKVFEESYVNPKFNWVMTILRLK